MPYLNGVIPTISCSRSGFDALKLYWRISVAAGRACANRRTPSSKTPEYFYRALLKRGVKAWKNPYSNTVIFRRPADEVVHKYALACSDDEHWGRLSHAVVMQYFTHSLSDEIASSVGA